jgi:hypothetical protein
MKTFKHYADTNPEGCERIHLGIATEIRKAELSGKCRMVEFKELDSNHFICLVPSLGITGRADTKAKSLLMMKKLLDHFCLALSKLPRSKIHSELAGLGWESNEFFEKNYSHLCISQYGVLRGFNVKADDVTTGMLEFIS